MVALRRRAQLYTQPIQQWWAVNSATTVTAASGIWGAIDPDAGASWTASNININVTAATTSATTYTLPWTTVIEQAQDVVWQTWNNLNANTIINRWNVVAHETEAQREQRRLQLAQYAEECNRTDAEYQQRVAAQRLEHERANARAEALLTEHLTAQQTEELRARGHFHLETIATNGERRRYRIRRGRHGNIDQVDAAGKLIKSLCVHPTMQVPDADTMLAQKLWLEFNEPELLRVANHIPRR